MIVCTKGSSEQGGFGATARKNVRRKGPACFASKMFSISDLTVMVALKNTGFIILLFIKLPIRISEVNTRIRLGIFTFWIANKNKQQNTDTDQ